MKLTQQYILYAFVVCAAVWVGSGCALGYGGGASLVTTTEGDIALMGRGYMRSGSELNNPYEGQDKYIGGVWYPISGLEGGAGLNLVTFRPVLDLYFGFTGLTYADNKDPDFLYTLGLQGLMRMEWNKAWDLVSRIGPSLKVEVHDVVERTSSYRWVREYNFDFETTSAAFDLGLLFEVSDTSGDDIVLSFSAAGFKSFFSTGRFSLQEPPEDEGIFELSVR